MYVYLFFTTWQLAFKMPAESISSVNYESYIRKYPGMLRSSTCVLHCSLITTDYAVIFVGPAETQGEVIVTGMCIREQESWRCENLA